MTLPALSLLETRVLGVLIEKQHTVPDTYPLTLNALSAGCNQKSSRDPVIDAAEAEVQAAVDALKRLSLVLETSGGRAMRYAHNFGRVLDVPLQATALLAVLMLRGAQTVGELRTNCERLHRFADVSSVDAFLRELAERPAGALVVELPRQPGSREPRWAQLLSGPPATPEAPLMAPLPRATGTVIPRATETMIQSEIAALRANVAELTAELEKMKSRLDRVCKQLGIDDM